jgi:hypothetical protein
MKHGMFHDYYRGNGFHISIGQWTLALRFCWNFYWTKVQGKPGYKRLYFGPFEIEHRGP